MSARYFLPFLLQPNDPTHWGYNTFHGTCVFLPAACCCCCCCCCCCWGGTTFLRLRKEGFLFILCEKDLAGPSILVWICLLISIWRGTHPHYLYLEGFTPQKDIWVRIQLLSQPFYSTMGGRGLSHPTFYCSIGEIRWLKSHSIFILRCDPYFLCSFCISLSRVIEQSLFLVLALEKDKGETEQKALSSFRHKKSLEGTIGLDAARYIVGPISSFTR